MVRLDNARYANMGSWSFKPLRLSSSAEVRLVCCRCCSPCDASKRLQIEWFGRFDLALQMCIGEAAVYGAGDRVLVRNF